MRRAEAHARGMDCLSGWLLKTDLDMECPDEVLDPLDTAILLREQDNSLRMISVLAEAIHDRLFGVASLKDAGLALREISDNGGIHEAVHHLLRALPPRDEALIEGANQ